VEHAGDQPHGFDESDTDMLVAMPLPLTDLFEDGLSPWERCVELRDENPDRTVFWGTVNPLEGRRALEQVEVQVNEYGAKAFKFYNVRYDYGDPFPWRMDDPKVAFPIYKKAQELGINLLRLSGMDAQGTRQRLNGAV
jgi:predicted TIM-barrel fold metal-dependent hydrolase